MAPPLSQGESKSSWTAPQRTSSPSRSRSSSSTSRLHAANTQARQCEGTEGQRKEQDQNRECASIYSGIWAASDDGGCTPIHIVTCDAGPVGVGGVRSRRPHSGTAGTAQDKCYEQTLKTSSGECPCQSGSYIFAWNLVCQTEPTYGRPGRTHQGHQPESRRRLDGGCGGNAATPGDTTFDGNFRTDRPGDAFPRTCLVPTPRTRGYTSSSLSQGIWRCGGPIVELRTAFFCECFSSASFSPPHPRHLFGGELRRCHWQHQSTASGFYRPSNTDAGITVAEATCPGYLGKTFQEPKARARRSTGTVEGRGYRSHPGEPKAHLADANRQWTRAHPSAGSHNGPDTWTILVWSLVGFGGVSCQQWRRGDRRAYFRPGTRGYFASDCHRGRRQCSWAPGTADLGRLACGHGTSLHYSHASAMQCSPGLAVATSLRLHGSTARKTRRGSGSPAGVRECTRPVQFCTSHSTGMAASGDTCGTRRAIQRLPTTSNVCYPRSNRVIKPPVPLSPSSRGVARNDRGGRQLVKTPCRADCCSQGPVTQAYLICGICALAGVLYSILNVVVRFPFGLFQFSGCSPNCNTGRRAGRTVTPRTDRLLRGKAWTLLWLLCFPAGHCMQLVPQATLGNQVVFGTNVRTDASPSLSWEMPAWHVDAQEEVRPAGTSPTYDIRRLVVYTHHIGATYIILATYVGNYGPSLHRSVCQLLSCDPQTYCLQRVISVLPALPSEQYTFAPLALPWHEVIVPVDLRPLGGNIQVVCASRSATCREIFQAAATDQDFQLLREVVCAAGDLLLMPDAQPLLLPAGDALQAWSSRSLSRRAQGLSFRRIPSTRQALPQQGVINPETDVPAQAVVIHAKGLVFLTNNDLARSASYGSLGRDIFEADLAAPANVFWYLPGLLTDLPFHQYLASVDAHEHHPCIVDFRAIGGQIDVGATLTPGDALQSLRQAVARVGEPIPGSRVIRLIDTGQVLLDCFRKTSIAHCSGGVGSIIVILLHWNQAVGTGLAISNDGTTITPALSTKHIQDDIDAAVATTHSLPILICMCWSLAAFRHTASSSLTFGLGLALGWRRTLVIGTSTTPSQSDASSSAPSPPRGSPVDFAVVGDRSLVSIASHHRLAQLLATQSVEHLPPLHRVFGREATSDRQICVQILGPAFSSRFCIPVFSLTSELGHRLRQAIGGTQRKIPVIAYPQFDWPCIQLVMPSKDQEL